MERLDYHSLLKLIHNHLRPRTYVEIGVHSGASFALARADTLRVGIDPILPATQPAAPSEKYFAVESDTFFEQNDLREILDGQPVDIAFIDGMHRFEFALRDFMNLEQFCTGESVILIHDCYPYNAEVASRVIPADINEVGWTGDVWKLIVCLKRYRPDLCVSVAHSPPSGLGIVTGLDPESSVLRDRYTEIWAALGELSYSYLDSRKDEELNVVGGTWDVVRALLPSRNAEITG
jgi:hypothetical protein